VKLSPAQQDLVQSNIGLVYDAARRYVFNENIEDSWQFSIGCIALCEAAVDYIPGSCEFSTYACNEIKNRIIDEYRKQQRQISAAPLDVEVPQETKAVFAVTLSGISDIETRRNVSLLQERFLGGRSIRELCEKHGTSRVTLYKWMEAGRKYIQTIFVE